MKRLLLALLLSTSAAAHAQSLSKALVVPTCTPGRELEQAGPGLQQLTQDTQGRLCAAATNAGSTNMVTPLMVNTSTPNNTTTTGQNPFGSNWNSMALRASPTPIPGTISNITAVSQNVIATGYWTFIFNVAGVSTPLRCSIGQGGTNLGTTTRCSDTTDTVDAYAGDLIGYQALPTGTPTTTGSLSLSALFTSLNGQESLIGNATNNFIPTTVIGFLGPSTLAVNNVTTTPAVAEALASAIMPADGILDHLYVSVPYALPATASVQFTVFKNGVATSITTTCSAPNTALQCTDLTHSLSVSVGDTISLEICASNVAGCPAGAVTGNVTMSYSLRWQPTVLHQAVLFNTLNGIGTLAQNYYLAVSSSVGTAVTESTYQNVAPANITLGNLLAAVCPGPGPQYSKSFTLRSNGASQVPTVTIPIGSVACPTLTVEQDTVDTYDVPANALINYFMLSTGTGATATNQKVSMTATVP